LPLSADIVRLLNNGVIGKLTGLTANLGYLVKDVPRLHDPALAGGALLDMGVYPINFASMVLGTEISCVSSSAILYHTGVDAQNSITLCYKSGAMAVLYSSMMSITDRKGIVFGDKGYMVVENINNPESVKIYNLDREIVLEQIRPKQITGFEYQVRSSVKAIHEGCVECPEMPHKEIIRVMELMDKLRREWGVVFPELE
jgi:predicted dehydrogenase